MQGLEDHHIACKHNWNTTIPLGIPCECHRHISERQYSLDSRWTAPANSENIKASFIIQGIQELFIEKHFKTNIKEYRLVADSLSYLIKSYRDKG
jgi:hypothetical protein